MTTNRALIIFIKNPIEGRVKTRLAQTVGNKKALAIYNALLGHTRKIATAIDASRFLFYSHFIDRSDDWSNTSFIKQQQQGIDLGQRMQQAFASAFEKHNQVVIIGSDCASLTPNIVDEAFSLLADHSFVIGPAHDGGYYLLGMNQYAPSVFENITWSTDEVFSSTIKNIENINGSYALLPTLSDIDFEEDWEKFGWEV